MAVWPRAVYLHVPFCLHHCGYCDFTLVARRDHLIPQWFDCLQRELQRHRQQAGDRLPVDTIFIGGGTPTHLSLSQLQQLGQLVSEHFELQPGGEYSMEANPDGLDRPKLELLGEIGVNRLSLGVQSFDDDVLRLLERTHRADAAAETVCLAASVLSAVSLDLMFGVPGQTEASWEQTLARASLLPVVHVSTYGLTWEQGTPFFRRQRSGELQRAEEELERSQYLRAIKQLTLAGFEHYEVSNFARPGWQCRHNLVYWRAEEYLAFGPGAARYVQGVRSTSCRSVVKWLRSWSGGQPCVEEEECCDPEQRAREAIMLGLRLRRGFDVADFEQRFGVQLPELAGAALEQGLRRGQLELADGRLRLTEDGLLLADSVTAEFL